MSYLINGNTVSREGEPRFRIVMRRDASQPPQAADIEWIDEPPRDVYSLAGYLQEAVRAWNEVNGGSL